MSEPNDTDETLTPQWEFRSLCKALYEQREEPIYANVLQPWLAEHLDECRSWLHDFAQRPGDPIPPAHFRELECLYAASRVSQKLLVRFQPAMDGEDRNDRLQISMSEYLAFFNALGMVVEAPEVYSPFYHEIVEVIEAADDAQPPSLVASYWPCLMLGEMLFSRAGACISVGRSLMRKDITERSKIYWAYTRNNRPCDDQSHGWGSNSQWRTDFRRDYRVGDDFHLNVDGREHVADVLPKRGPPDPTPVPRRMEVVKYWSLVLSEPDFYDECPYPYRMRLSDTAPSISDAGLE